MITDREGWIVQKVGDTISEHVPLEEVRIEDVDCLDPPDGWNPDVPGAEPVPPPVLIEEEGRFSLLVNHDSFWRARAAGMLSIRALVVRNPMHIPPAHKAVKNSLEEALLFDGLLRTAIVPNRSRLAELLDFSRARITQVLNVLKLPLAIRRELLVTGSISEFHLRPLIKMDDEKRQVASFRKLLADGLTGRQMALFAASGDEGEVQAGVDLESLMAQPVLVTPPGPAEHAADPQAGPKGSPAPQESPASAEAESAPEDVGRAEHDAPSGGDRTKAPRQAAKPDQTLSDTPSSAERALYMRAKGLLEVLGTLREKGWEEKATRNGATREEMVFLEGVSLLRKGQYEKAAETLTNASHLSRGNAAVFFFLGRSYNLLEKLSSAEEYLRAACEHVPDDPDILSELAIVLEKQKRYTEASSFYKRASAIRNPPAQAKGRRQ